MHYRGDYDLSGPHPSPHKAPGLAQQWHWECWWHNSSPPYTNVTVTMSIWFLWLVLFFNSLFFFGYLNLFLIVHYFMSLITYKTDPNWLHPSCSLSAIKLSLKVLDSGKKWEEWDYWPKWLPFDHRWWIRLLSTKVFVFRFSSLHISKNDLNTEAE